MPMNVGFEYVNAEQEYNEAKTTSEKAKALKKYKNRRKAAAKRYEANK